jgi:GT2 family glycosyltransferase
MQLSVIILNYKVRYFLELCVLSVQKALEGMDAEIIVVDNDSSDDSCAMMKLRFPNVKLIENKENVGFPKGNNIGVAHAKGEYICILNPDTVVAEDTFRKILDFAKAQINLGIVGCKLIDGTGKFLPESKRGVPTPWVAFTKLFGLYNLFPKTSAFNKYYAQHLSPNETGKVAILVGAFMVLKRELYIEIGGFDERYFMYGEDVDLSYMALLKGKNNFYFHDTTVIHYKGESTVKDGTYMIRFQKAMHFFYKKHFNGSVFFDVFMKVGIVLFSIIKMFQGKQKPKTLPDSYGLFTSSDQLESLMEKLQNRLTLKVESAEMAKLATNKKIEFIIDLETITFKQAINILEEYHKPNHTFKLWVPKTDFIIGSNSSNDRGEVILLNEFNK